ncbi:MAG: hypothetical protein IKK08_03275 [Clostridia bacterium]|nr:hypothetical protein [Clostridia bacterium]
MQQRNLFMKPALQPGEAVLLPALPGNRWQETIAAGLKTSDESSTFIPAGEEWKGQTTALSTQVRTSGSMAGRSVLRAAGFGNAANRSSAWMYPGFSSARACRRRRCGRT